MTFNHDMDGLRFTRNENSKALVFIKSNHYPQWLSKQDALIQNWLGSQHFSAQSKNFILLPNAQGLLNRVLVIADDDDPFTIAHLPKLLPKGDYHRCPSSSAPLSMDHLVLGWGLGAYRYDRYITKNSPACLHAEAMNPVTMALIRESCLVRNLVNTPAEQMGPDQLELAVKESADEFSATFSCIKGDDLLTENFPTIYAVGRASHRAPRLVRLDWGDRNKPHVVICGKGVCFDTGGLDLKSADGMRNMKKDMGGAAHALALARLIMSQQLPVQLTLFISAVDNAISGNAFRPGDVIVTRQGLSVEIDNTDAEGRLVLADALCLASELKPDLILDFATLTGAARVALGPDLPALFCNRDDLASTYLQSGSLQHDPLWRMPLWKPYLHHLKSNVADLANAGASKMAGSISAALFLQRFVSADLAWAHVDLYSWNDFERPGKPAGGEAQGLRASFDWLNTQYNP